jgi:hypothetical protein
VRDVKERWRWVRRERVVVKVVGGVGWSVFVLVFVLVSVDRSALAVGGKGLAVVDGGDVAISATGGRDGVDGTSGVASPPIPSPDLVVVTSCKLFAILPGPSTRKLFPSNHLGNPDRNENPPGGSLPSTSAALTPSPPAPPPKEYVVNGTING